MPRDPKRNSKSRVYSRNRYRTSAAKKAALKKANEARLEACRLRREKEQENLPAITATNTELATPYELRSQVQEREIEPEDDRVEPVGDSVDENIGTENDRVEPVIEADEEIRQEQEAAPENAVANEGAESFQPSTLFRLG